MFSAGHSLLNVVVPQVPGKLFGGRRAVLVICLISTHSLKAIQISSWPVQRSAQLDLPLPEIRAWEH